MNKREIEIKKEDASMNASVALQSSEDGIDIYRIDVKLVQAAVPAVVTLTWQEDMTDMLSCWFPTIGRNRAMHQGYGTVCRSDFCAGAPVLTVIGSNDKNRFTVSVAEPERPVTIAFRVDELLKKVFFRVELFAKPCAAITDYSTELRIDCRDIPFYSSISEVYGHFKTNGYEIPPCTVYDEDPLYSTWYTFHQTPRDKELLEELKCAAKLGIKTVIIDDGWQIEGAPARDYSNNGDWRVSPDRFADLKGFVDAVHALGIKVMLWFSVPFVGYDSDAYEHFKGKYLYSNDGCRASILDPRFPDVREFIIKLYIDFMREYSLDGLKLDFIQYFHDDPSSSKEYELMDEPVVEEAVKLLLNEMTSALKSEFPDVMVEFRSPYMGPSMVKHCSMLRVSDCAYDALTNRIESTGLRMLNYPIAIHSDMLLWGVDEAPELCVRQLLNIMFCVPQISVKLCTYPKYHAELLGNFLEYWNAHRDILLHGTFKAKRPDLNYTALSAENDELRISVLYSEMPYVFDGKECDVFNASDLDFVAVKNQTDRPVEAQMFDCFGKPAGNTVINALSAEFISVPVSGMVSLRFS